MNLQEYSVSLLKVIRVALDIERLDLTGIEKVIDYGINQLEKEKSPSETHRKAFANLAALKVIVKALAPIKPLAEELRNTILDDDLGKPN